MYISIFLDEPFLKKQKRLLMPKFQRFEIDIGKICGIAPIIEEVQCIACVSLVFLCICSSHYNSGGVLF